METFLVEHKTYDKGKLIGMINEDGKEYYIVEWPSLVGNNDFGTHDYYITKLPVSDCKLIRKPGKLERVLVYKIHRFFKFTYTIEKWLKTVNYTLRKRNQRSVTPVSIVKTLLGKNYLGDKVREDKY